MLPIPFPDAAILLVSDRIGTSGIIRLLTTGFLSSSQLCRPEPVWKMASKSEDLFHKAIKFHIEKERKNLVNIYFLHTNLYTTTKLVSSKDLVSR